MEMFFGSKYHNIKLVIVGADEPNNGRMLHVADLYINDELQNNKYFGNWNRLNWNLDEYMFESDDGKFIYIPQENGGFLIETKTLNKIYMPVKSVTANTFLKNRFAGNLLEIVYKDKTITINLDNFLV